MKHVRLFLWISMGLFSAYAITVFSRGFALPVYAADCESQGGACRSACLPFEDQLNGSQYACSNSSDFCCKDKSAGPVVGGVESNLNKTVPSSGGTSGQAANSVPTALGGLQLVTCTKTGDCSLDQIVVQGVNFAKFIMGLSSALFFAVFVYGGARYLLSFGRKSWVEAGTKAMTGAAFGMVLVLGAWTIVRTLVQGIGGKIGTGGGGTSCESQGQGYTCTTLSGSTTEAAMTDAQQKNMTCLPGFCQGPNNVICCKKN